jgi:hypothetical protein
MLTIYLQLSTLSAFDLGSIHHHSHALLEDKDAYCLAQGNQ